MKVFLGWSGERSKQVARALREWLPNVIQHVKPWMSEEDIPAGHRWSIELSSELEQTNFGIIALTPENALEPWIHFEAGALTKQLGESAVCPYLVEIVEKTEVTGPLAQFQLKRATKDDTLALLKDINAACDEDKLTDQRLIDTFERWWPDLEKTISSLPTIVDQRNMRSDRELLEEVLERVRSLDRRSSEAQMIFPGGFSEAQASLLSKLMSPTRATDETDWIGLISGTPTGGVGNREIARRRESLSVHAKARRAAMAKVLSEQGKKNGEEEGEP